MTPITYGEVLSPRSTRSCPASATMTCLRTGVQISSPSGCKFASSRNSSLLCVGGSGMAVFNTIIALLSHTSMTHQQVSTKDHTIVWHRRTPSCEWHRSRMKPSPTSLLLTMVQLFLDWQRSCTHMRWRSRRMDFMGWSPTCLTLLSTRPPSSTTRPHTRFHLVPSMTTCTLQLFRS